MEDRQVRQLMNLLQRIADRLDEMDKKLDWIETHTGRIEG